MEVKDIDAYEQECSKKYGEDIPAIIKELNACGCGCADINLYIDWDFLPADDPFDFNYNAGYVAECGACEMRTRMVESPYQAKIIWNNAFRNDSNIFEEIGGLKARIEALEN